MFELGARPHPPRELYRAYLEQSHVFVGIYWQRYGWVAPDESISGLEDEYRLAAAMPQLIYIKEPAPEREEELQAAAGDPEAGPDVVPTLPEHGGARGAGERGPGGPVERAVRVGASGRAATARRIAPGADTDDRAGRRSRARARAARERRPTDHVTGPGGVGKTRVALAAAHAREQAGAEPVYHVALASVSTPTW